MSARSPVYRLSLGHAGEWAKRLSCADNSGPTVPRTFTSQRRAGPSKNEGTQTAQSGPSRGTTHFPGAVFTEPAPVQGRV